MVQWEAPNRYRQEAVNVADAAWRLEYQPEYELKLPPLVPLVWVHTTETGTSDSRIRVVGDEGVRQVVGLHPEFELDAFRDRELLGQGVVYVPVLRSLEVRVVPGIGTWCIPRRYRERRSIEPLGAGRVPRCGSPFTTICPKPRMLPVLNKNKPLVDQPPRMAFTTGLAELTYCRPLPNGRSQL